MKRVLQTSWQRVASGAAFLQQGVATLVFPPSCLCCEAELGEAGTEGTGVSICDDCLSEMSFFGGPICERCGASVPFAKAADKAPSPRPSPKGRESSGCHRCRGPKIWFDETVALGLYGGRLKDVLLRMKQAEGDALSLALGRLIWKMRGERLAALGADVVVPIPLHWRRRLAHRTNSAAMLAEILSSRLGVPMANGLLRRTRSTHKQFDLTPPKRWENVRRAFAVRAGYHLRDAHVLVVDDILTTGATCSEAARALRSAGAARVTIVVAARAFGNL